MTSRALNHSANHSSTNQEEFHYQDIGEWQREAIQPFVDDLAHRNQGVLHEIAKELQDVTNLGAEKHRVSWLDDHRHEPNNPAHPEYQARALNGAEKDIMASYANAAQDLDPNQLGHLTGTIMEAVAHRPSRALNHHLPHTKDFAEHHQRDTVADPDSYNHLMTTAKEYYAQALSEAENYFLTSLKNNDSESMTYAVDTFRTIEADIEHTAATGHLPSYMEHIDRDQDFLEAYHQRGDILHQSLIEGFKEKHPELPPDPETREFEEHFKDATKDYLPGDLHNIADLIAERNTVEKSKNVSSIADVERIEFTHGRQLYDRLTNKTQITDQ